MCCACNYCKYMYTKKKPILPNGQIFCPRHFANCETIGVVYMLHCDCGCFYIDKTKLEFWKRVHRHIQGLQTSSPELLLGRHTNSTCTSTNFQKLNFSY